MKKEDLLLSRLMDYQNSNAIPFHMPGHKRRTEHGMLKAFPNPYSIDITEIDGFDNLHHPEGILKESMEWAAEIYHADKTYYLVNGSSGGILSAVCAATHPGGKILMSRNCHKAAYHGVILNGLEPEYIYPQILDEMGIQGGICPADVENMLSRGPLPEAVLVVSPTYDGIVSDIQAIAEIVHDYGIPLIVDEAHGAHFPFGKGFFPKSALECGADMVIQSLHKTLPSFTQTAVLHVRRERVNIDKLERYLQIFQSSSPSYLFMAGIENCIYEMEQHGGRWMEEFSVHLAQLRGKLCGLKHLRLLGADSVGVKGIFDVDLSKLVISCRGCLVRRSETGMHGIGDEWISDDTLSDDTLSRGMSGGEILSGELLSRWLREEYHLEMEMSGADYIVAIATFMDSWEHLDRLADALLHIDNRIDRKPDSTEDMQRVQHKIEMDGIICIKPADALEAGSEALLINQCAGRISAEFIYLYPPGIPIVAPGELVTEAIVRQVEYYKRIGLPVQGMAHKDAGYLKVLRG